MVLREVAQVMKSKMRGSDVVCCYGGEEFAIISPEMSYRRNEGFPNRVARG